jgi:NOL1/NOP2/fmu family ribosome biogenesis protein
MFRKHPNVLDEWTVDLVKMCAKRSLEVLTNASKALKQGGRLVYSTCTYNLEENEKTVLEFLKNNPDFKVVDTGLDFGQEGLLGLNLARRITIADGGEGHFVCALERVGAPPFKKIKPFKTKNNFEILSDFTKGTPKFLNNGEKFGLLQFGDSFYAVQDGTPDVSGVRVMRVGVKLGTFISKTLKPDHHFFMAADPDCLKATVCVSEEQVFEFYKGNTLNIDNSLRGYVAVIYDGVSVGFGKAVGGTLKNHLPKGLRI